MIDNARGRSTGLTLGAVLLWLLAGGALWFLLLRGGEDQVLLMLGEGAGTVAGNGGDTVTSVAVLGVVAALVLGAALGSLACAERLSVGPSPAALVAAGAAVLLLVVAAVAVLFAQMSMATAVADAATVSGETANSQVVAAVVTIVLAIAALGAVAIGLRRARGGRRA